MMHWRIFSFPLLSALALALTFAVAPSSAVVGGERGEMCAEVVVAPASENLEATLFEWCCDDPACALAFQQSYRKNFTVFKHLVDPHLFALGEPAPSLYGLARALLCEEYDDREIARRLWMMDLVAKADRHRPMCGIDHYPVFDTASLTTECICKPDRSCSENTEDLVPFYVILVLVVVLFLLFVGGTFYKIMRVLRTMDAVYPTTKREFSDLGMKVFMSVLSRGTDRQ